MTKNLLRAGALSCALLATTCLTAPASAAEPAFRNLDANGVDLTHGDYRLTFTEASAGTGETALDLVRAGSGLNDFTTWDRLTFQRSNAGGTTEFVTVGNAVTWDNYSGPPGNLSPTVPNGSSVSGADAYFAHRGADGTLTEFTDPSQQSGGGSNFCTDTTPTGASCVLLPTSITQPDGRAVTLEWELHSIASGQNIPQDQHHYFRLSRVSNSYGYAVQFSYANNSPTPGQAPPSNWYSRTGAALSGNAGAIGSVGYAAVGGAVQVTDMAGRVWRIAGNPVSVSAIRRPGETSDSISITTSGNTTTVVRDGVTTTYSRVVSGSTATTTVTDAAGAQTVVVSNMTIGRPTSVTVPVNRTTSYAYDGYGRLTRVTRPEGNYVEYTLDGRGNATQTRFVPKPGSTLTPIITSANFPSNCSNPLTCNRPTSTTDALLNTTDYTYDSTHGGVLSVTGPAVEGGRPETRYSYTLANGEYRLTGISTCQAGSAPTCVGGTDEARTALAYDASGNLSTVQRYIGNNATPISTITMTYTPAGDLASQDGPLSGSFDTTYFRYNAARQPIGAISPDPDDTGALVRRARRITYGSNALPTKMEVGTVNGISDTDWNNFATLEEVQIGYDSALRPNVRRLVSGGTTYALTQSSFDLRGMVECVATRMNPAEFSSLPSSACALDTEGSFGPDRIVKYVRDDVGQVLEVHSGYLTSAAAIEKMTYRPNGQVETVTDGEGNRTTFVFDGHDRLSRTNFPVADPLIDNTSSETDYEELGYDANTNVASRRLRDGAIISYDYDSANRLIEKDLPGSELTVSYDYDLIGRMTGASTSAQSLSFTFDALGRNLTQVSPVGTTSMQYDSADRRTLLTYPGSGLAIGYTYNAVGEMTHIRENPSGSNTLLATYTYDNRGRRESLVHGSVNTTYAYDSISRLTQLSRSFPSSADNLTLGFGYNPAGQISNVSRSNDAYAYAHASGSRTDSYNGRNQMTGFGLINVGHDDRGNTTSVGTMVTSSYSSENLMVAAMVGFGNNTSFVYDPLNRLLDLTENSAHTRFGYDGGSIISEHDSIGTVQRRFVRGAGIDEILVWYEGSGTSISHHLYDDERGSIISVGNSSGVVENINRYDEYGLPATTNVGRFQYTGQPWLKLSQEYYYRTRMYNPNLGRFMQPDRVGYGGGLNLYTYVMNDPVNRRDPLGFDWDCNELGCVWQEDVIVTVSRSGGTILRTGGEGLLENMMSLGDLGMEIAAVVVCQAGLQEARKDREALVRARQSWNDLASAAARNMVDPSILAAIGVRESGFSNIGEVGGGGGRGVFQITGNGVSDEVAFDIGQSAEWTAGRLRSNIDIAQNRLTNVSDSEALMVGVAGHNLNIERGSRRGWTAQQFNEATTGHNYGSNVLQISQCF